MAETFAESKKPEEKGRLPQKSGFREWFKRLFGKPKRSETLERPRKFEGEVHMHKNIREEIPELKKKPISTPFAKLQKTLQEPDRQQREPMKAPIRNLDHVDDAALVEMLTGEGADPKSELSNSVSERAIEEAMREKNLENARLKSKAEILGEYPEKVEDEIDLHGKHAEEAGQSIRLFVLAAKRHGLRKIRVITGKGIHSENGEAILKRVAEEKVGKLVSERVVFAFVWEKGRGSMLVYLM